MSTGLTDDTLSVFRLCGSVGDNVPCNLHIYSCVEYWYVYLLTGFYHNLLLG